MLSPPKLWSNGVVFPLMTLLGGNWDELCAIHNLEDKIGFDGEGIDTDEPIM